MGDAAAAAEEEAEGETRGGGIMLAEAAAGVEEVGVPFVALGGVTRTLEGGVPVVGMCICKGGGVGLLLACLFSEGAEARFELCDRRSRGEAPRRDPTGAWCPVDACGKGVDVQGV